MRNLRVHHKWDFENGFISMEELKAITKDFEKVLPFIETKFLAGVRSQEGIGKHQNWTCFRTNGEYITDTFFFGTENISSGQSIRMNGGLYSNAVIAFLSIAKKHLQHDIHIETSLSNWEWEEAMKLCSNILGHDYDLMDITVNGKLRFRTWEREAVSNG